MLLGTNSTTASGGALTWFSFWQLPNTGGEWTRIGPVSLLPIISLATWALYRFRTRTLLTITWGAWRIILPLFGLWALALLSVCDENGCDLIAWLRLLALLAHLMWVYLLIVNERPDLFWVLTAIVASQASVAIAQFIWQSDVGLQFLGELALDPAELGVSIVMRDGERWLRGYGLTVHPNTLARTLLPGMLLLLIFLRNRPTRLRQIVVAGYSFWDMPGSLTTLSRWGLACMFLGLLLFALPQLRQAQRSKHLALSATVVRIGASVAAVSALFLIVYGSTVVGRVVELDTPIENRSLWERQRDTNISVELFSEHPWRGVGYGQYLEWHARKTHGRRSSIACRNCSRPSWAFSVCSCGLFCSLRL